MTILSVATTVAALGHVSDVAT
uniref:Uncharacterized protein n=1 Tax=Lepeophtheirus salmonis TaxID=72036 RepID=A0A0K2UCD2_LEPSM